MKYPSDRDGKSKTASAVDQEHYPEQHEVENLDPRDQGSSDAEDQNKTKRWLGPKLIFYPRVSALIRG